MVGAHASNGRRPPHFEDLQLRTAAGELEKTERPTALEVERRGAGRPERPRHQLRPGSGVGHGPEFLEAPRLVCGLNASPA